MRKLMIDLKDRKLEFDADMDRWNYYKDIYSELNIDIEKTYPNRRKDRLIGRFEYLQGFKQINKYAQENTSIELSGDIFFNFNDKKIAAFKSNIKPSSNTIERLNLYNTFHNSDENCVLMPVTGGMNNVKGKAYFLNKSLVISAASSANTAYDRPDTLVYLIDQFYNTRKEKLSLKDAGEFYARSIFRDALNTFNFSIYYDFMDSFKCAFKFCQTFFKLDETLFNRMIASGGKPIKTEEDLLSYLNLAQDYWDYKRKISAPMQ